MRRIALRELSFKLISQHVRLVALPQPRPIAAIVVILATFALGVFKRHATPACLAPEDTALVVLPGARTHARATMRIEHPLYPVEQLGRDDRLMPSLVPLPVVVNLAQVVAVPEHLSDRRP